MTLPKYGKVSIKWSAEKKETQSNNDEKHVKIYIY